jgi:CubicO group peptidase (beta-lactamase class C family)
MTSITPLNRSNPEAEGISSSAILTFIRAVEQHLHPLDAVHGFMLLRYGNVAAEGWWTPYRPQAPHRLYSLSKSFTSTGIGLAVAEGLLTVDDPILQFFPDDAPAKPGENLKAMCVRHLLSMNTGHHEDTTRQVFGNEDDNWPHVFLSLPVEHQPGTWFVYNTAATYMLSAIITKLTGQTLLDYLRPRLFEPLGVENPSWDADPRGVSIGGSGLHITTEGIARFGQLYLQKGMWNERRILSEEWIAQATKATSDNSNTQTNPDWIVGYGYQFWRCQHDCYRGDGAFGQYCIIMPEQDAVLAMNSGVRNMQAVLDKVWEHLLPAMQPDALPSDPHSYGALSSKLAALSLPLPEGQPSLAKAEQWSGQTYTLEQNDLQLERVAISFGDECSVLTIHNERGEHQIPVGTSTWLHGISNVRGIDNEPVAACSAWTAENTYEVRVCYTEGEFCPVFRFHYTSDGLQLDVEPNVSWGPSTVTRLTGQVIGEQPHPIGSTLE